MSLFLFICVSLSHSRSPLAIPARGGMIMWVHGGHVGHVVCVALTTDITCMALTAALSP
jgi:hypothetical protein